LFFAVVMRARKVVASPQLGHKDVMRALARLPHRAQFAVAAGMGATDLPGPPEHGLP